MNKHNRYGTGTADLKKDLRFRITELKSQAWGLERSEKFFFFLNIYRDIIGLQDAQIAIQDSEIKELEHEHEHRFSDTEHTYN